MSARTQRFWTKDEVLLARQMEADGFSHAEIGRRLDRSAHAITGRLCRRNDNTREEQLPRRSVTCAPQQLAQAQARLDAQKARDWHALRTGRLTPILLGDPPPGRSALDEKRRGA
jgi:hypothetical protein